jgi:hypothetical protein
MIRSWIRLSAIFATLGVALAGCAGNAFSPGYYAGGYPYGISGYYCGEWRVWPGASCVDPRVAHLNRGGKQAEPQFRGHAAAQNRR